eukprot:4794255-Amphidinium_carterae.1
MHGNACKGEEEHAWYDREAQRTQAAQAGYACDHQNKRLPIAVHEIKEWQKAQKQLSVELQDKP